MLTNSIKKIMAGIVAGCAISSVSYADPHYATYEITVTNLTNAPFLSEPVVAIHKSDFKLFELGEPNTSPGLEVVAETGLPTALVEELKLNSDVSSVRYLMGTAPNGGLLPGETTSGIFKASKEFSHFSVFSMIAPSNDAFVSANSVPVPRKYKKTVIFSPGYDAGTEANNELCDTAVPTNINDPDSIPVPPPARAGICIFTPTIPARRIAAVGSPGEGKILIHRGFQGIGNINPSVFDWRNPTARITIKRVHEEE